jgi:hypothetical protein
MFLMKREQEMNPSFTSPETFHPKELKRLMKKSAPILPAK